MSAIDEFWERCRAALPAEGLGARYAVRSMGNTAALSEKLLEFVRRGEKTGLFSRPADLAAAGLAPAPGDYVVFTDFAGRPRCLVRMEECRLLRFGDVGPAETACESPAARDPATWRDIHGRYWKNILQAEGGAFSDDLELLFQRFRLLHFEPA